MGTLSNPFDPKKRLGSGCACGLHGSAEEHHRAKVVEAAGHEPSVTPPDTAVMPEKTAFADTDTPDWNDQEGLIERCVETAVIKSIFGSDMSRRHFLRAVGA